MSVATPIMHVCSDCPYKSPREREVRSHHRAVHLGERYACEACKATFTKRGNLKRHQLIHPTERTYQPRRDRLKDHERSYQCPECSYNSSRKGNLNIHIRNRHCSEYSYLCDECSEEFGQEYELQKHRYIHSDEKLYHCQHCNYFSRQKGTLKSHELTHTDAKPHVCPRCAYRCKTPRALEQHVIGIHTKQKPYHCEHCSYRSAYSSNLSTHKREKHSPSESLVLASE